MLILYMRKPRRERLKNFPEALRCVLAVKVLGCLLF